MYMLNTVFIFLVILYILIIVLFRHYWDNYPVFISSGQTNATNLSVIVTFRNEIKNLPACLNSLLNQTYPGEQFEVILADDHSYDGSSDFAADFCRHHAGFRYCSAAPEEKGKKASLIRGIKNSSYDTVVLTDADCIVGEKWLDTIAGFYQRYHPEMIIGLVEMNTEEGLFGKFQELEFQSLTGTAAGAAAMGRPLFCSSANLIFSKASFEKYHDPFKKDVVSGDDTLFMLQLKKDSKKRIMLLKSPWAVVVTHGVHSLREFISQRSRWISKTKHYRDQDILFTAAIVLIVNATIFASLVMLLTGLNFWLFPVLLTLKTFADCFFVKQVVQFFGKKASLCSFFVYEIVYMIYALLVSVSGCFFKFRWKERRFRS